jgi:hypothetical protein
MPTDQAVADAKGRLGAATRYKNGVEQARRELNAALLHRDIRKALEAGLSDDQIEAARRLLLDGRA